MGKIELTAAEQRSIASRLSDFEQYVGSDEFAHLQEERRARVGFFQKELPARLDELTEADLDEVIRSLWASRFWGNQEYHVQRVLGDNGLEGVREGLRPLYRISDPVATRYKQLLEGVKGLGPAAVTEMLCYVQPSKCGIWNRRARTALATLQLTTYVNPHKYCLTPAEYDRFNELANVIAEQIHARLKKIEQVDLLLVDFFLYWASRLEDIDQPEIPPEAFDHDEIRDLIRDIGAMLGFDSDTEVTIAHGARVDVVWRARIANLGTIMYVFEVQKGGSPDSLLLNLQKAMGRPAVQKVVAVSDTAQLGKIEKECDGLPFEFKHAMSMWKVADVQQVGRHLEKALAGIRDVGLVQDL